MNEPPTLHPNLPHAAITHNIIGSFYEVFNTLGRGFAERVYQRALAHDLRASSLLVDTETPAEVRYRGLPIARFRTDLIVEHKVLVEIKALAQLEPSHTAQVLNYLRATKLEVGLLLNFGRRAEFRRLVMSRNPQPGTKHPRASA